MQDTGDLNQKGDIDDLVGHTHDRLSQVRKSPTRDEDFTGETLIESSRPGQPQVTVHASLLRTHQL